MSSDPSHILKQFFRYVLVGASCNLAGYCLYLLLTYGGLTPKLTVSILYPVGVLINFLANRKFTFNSQGFVGTSALRFLLAHIVGYLINISMLMILVDKAGLPHQLVQFAAVVLVAIYFFIVYRVFVFVENRQPRKKRVKIT